MLRLEQRIANHMLQNMGAVNQSYYNHHLIYPDEISLFKQRVNYLLFSFDDLALPEVTLSSESQKYFDVMEDFRGLPKHLCYQLKPKKSASKALQTILEQGTTACDCGMAIVIARYLTILSLLIEQHGSKKGKACFDMIFGSETNYVPNLRRIVLSKYCMGHSSKDLFKDFCDMPFNPLSYFISPSLYASNNFSENKPLALGETIYQPNHLDYKVKFPAGMFTGYNLVYAGYNSRHEDVFLAYGLRGVHTIQQIKEILSKQFNKPLNILDHKIISSDVKTSIRYLLLKTQTITSQDVPDSQFLSSTTMSAQKVEEVLTLSLPEFIRKFEEVLNQEREKYFKQPQFSHEHEEIKERNNNKKYFSFFIKNKITFFEEKNNTDFFIELNTIKTSGAINNNTLTNIQHELPQCIRRKK